MKIGFIIPSLLSHYSDGVGRTGAFITIHAQMERMKSEAVVEYIKAIRIQRLDILDMVSNKVTLDGHKIMLVKFEYWPISLMHLKHTPTLKKSYETSLLKNFVNIIHYQSYTV